MCKTLGLSAVLLVLLVEVAGAQSVPMGINYQGVLRNANNEVLATDDYALMFRIYAGAEEGNPLWQQAFALVPVVDGAFNVVLGPKENASQAEIDQWLTAFSDSPRYLEIQVDTAIPLLPRQKILAAPFALRAARAAKADDSAKLGGKDVGAFVAKSGDTMTGPLSASTSTLTGSAVIGYASNDSDESNSGGTFKAEGWAGRGVQGTANSAGPKTNYGGLFEAKGAQGVGVQGAASSTSDSMNYGGLFVARGRSGRGVYGLADNTDTPSTECNYGGYFVAQGPKGRGVYASGVHIGVTGCATETVPTNATYGGYFTSSGGSGRGVTGRSDTHAGVEGQAPIYGGWFQAEGAGDNCSGVYGEASSSGSGITTFGGNFVSRAGQGIGVQASGKKFCFYAAGPGPDGPFTGAHEVRLCDDFPHDAKPGLLVSAKGVAPVRIEEGEVCISSTLPTVELSGKPNDKAILGAIVMESPLPKDHWYQPSAGQRFAIVNAVGEGRAWVCNGNGNIEVGDYLTTSAFPGYGQKQDDDILHSYTLGKATETVDWASVPETVEFNGQTYKVYLIALVYTSG